MIHTKFTSGLTGDVTLDKLLMVGLACMGGWGVAKGNAMWTIIGLGGAAYVMLK